MTRVAFKQGIEDAHFYATSTVRSHYKATRNACFIFGDFAAVRFIWYEINTYSNSIDQKRTKSRIVTPFAQIDG